MLVSSRFGQRVYNHVKRMEKSEYIILLERFLKGETTHDEERILVDWFKSDVSRDELRNYIQRKWEIASNSSIPTDLKERMFRKIQSRIESVAVEKKEVGRFSLRNIMRYAAIGLLVICAGLGGHLLTRYSRSVGAEKDYLVFAAKGQKASVVLPDGSKVWLNSDSEIKYTNLYGDGERIISLDGEAYFEVRKNEKLPFDVMTKELNVKVLGTKFNFRNYDEDEEVTVNLLEGKVQLENYVKKMGVNYLSPSEKVTLNKLTGEMIISRAEVKNAKEWTNGGLFFDEMPLSDIVKELNRSYNVKIHIADEQLTHNRFYALFNRKEQTIYNVLDIITATNQVRYKVEGDSILLYAK